MTKLQQIRKLADSAGIKGTIARSTKKNKKFMITLPDGKVIHFGQIGYEDYLTHHDEQRRANYLARASAIKNKAGALTAHDIHSPNYYSIKLLWAG